MQQMAGGQPFIEESDEEESEEEIQSMRIVGIIAVIFWGTLH